MMAFLESTTNVVPRNHNKKRLMYFIIHVMKYILANFFTCFHLFSFWSLTTTTTFILVIWNISIFKSELVLLFREHLGESIVYIWVEKLRELVRVETEFSANPHNIPSGTEKCESKHNTSLADLTAGYDETSATCTSTAATDPFVSEYLINQFSNSMSFNPAIGAAGDSYDGGASNFYGKNFSQESLYRIEVKLRRSNSVKVWLDCQYTTVI